MPDEKKSVESSVLSKVSISRRGFVKSLTLGTAFAVPLITSYSMDGLRVSMANAGFMTNSTNQVGGGFFGFIRHLFYKLFHIFGGRMR